MFSNIYDRCVFYGKPLLESGTLGTKCNVQVSKGKKITQVNRGLLLLD